MNIPGFTADASLYKTRAHYIATGQTNRADGQKVITQLSLGSYTKHFNWTWLCSLDCWTDPTGHTDCKWNCPWD